MSDSESSSDSSQTTNYSDSRKVLGQGSASDGSSVTTDSGNTWENSGNTTTNITALDGGAIGKAFATTDKTVSEAFGFGTDALGFAQNGFGKVLGFASDTMKKAFDTNSDTTQEALDFAQHAQERSTAQVNTAMSTATNAMGAALSFGAKQTASALDSLNRTAQLVDNAYADAKGRGAMTDYLMMAAIAGAMFVAWSATRKGRA